MKTTFARLFSASPWPGSRCRAELDQLRSVIGSELEALRVEVEETARELAAAHRELEILRTLRVLAYQPDGAGQGGETPLLN
jgi:hypothetical protein